MALKRMVNVCISLHMELLGPDIQYIRASLPNYGYLALPTGKRILRDVLQSTSHCICPFTRYCAYRFVTWCGGSSFMLIFFRGLLDNKPNNTMASLSDAHITEAVTNRPEANPPRTNPPSRSMTIMVHAFFSSSDCQRTRDRKVQASGKPCSLSLFLFRRSCSTVR